MAKDRAVPFSKKHRKYWLPVTGGMILIGAINLLIGYWSWPETSMDRTPEQIKLQLPVSPYERPDAAARDAGPVDGGPGDAAGKAPPTSDAAVDGAGASDAR